MRNSIDDFASTVHAISAGEIFGIRCLHRFGIHYNLAAIQLEIGNVLKESKLLLSEGPYHHIDLERKFTSRYGTEGAPA